MAQLSKNKKYVELEDVRVFYNKKTNQVELTSGDPDLTGKVMQISVRQGTDTDQSLRELLIDHGVLGNTPDSTIPTYIKHPSLKNLTMRYTFPDNPTGIALGVGAHNEIFWWDQYFQANLHVMGQPGTGKSMLARNILWGACRTPDEYEVYVSSIIYGKEEYVAINQYKAVKDFALDAKETLTMLQTINQRMEDRQEEMRKIGANDYKALHEKEYNTTIIVILDEIDYLLHNNPAISISNQAEDELTEVRSEIEHLLFLMTAQYRNMGLRTVFSSTSGIRNVVEKNNFWMGLTPMLIGNTTNSRALDFLKPDDSDDPILLRIPNNSTGRVVVSNFGKLQEFQIYALDWVPFEHLPR